MGLPPVQIIETEARTELSKIAVLFVQLWRELGLDPFEDVDSWIRHLAADQRQVLAHEIRLFLSENPTEESALNSWLRLGGGGWITERSLIEYLDGLMLQLQTNGD